MPAIEAGNPAYSQPACTEHANATEDVFISLTTVCTQDKSTHKVSLFLVIDSNFCNSCCASTCSSEFSGSASGDVRKGRALAIGLSR